METWTLPTVGTQPWLFQFNGLGVGVGLWADGRLATGSLADVTVEKRPWLFEYDGHDQRAGSHSARCLANGLTCEIWNYDGTGYAMDRTTIASIGALSYDGGTIGGSVTASLGFLRVFTTHGIHSWESPRPQVIRVTTRITSLTEPLPIRAETVTTRPAGSSACQPLCSYRQPGSGRASQDNGGAVLDEFAHCCGRLSGAVRRVASIRWRMETRRSLITGGKSAARPSCPGKIRTRLRPRSRVWFSDRTLFSSGDGCERRAGFRDAGCGSGSYG